MALLLEGMTLVFENETLEEMHPLGIKGFISEWNNGSFCTDGTISKLSFFEFQDGFCVLAAMKGMGLAISTRYAADVAVFMHDGSPWLPCLWLETEKHVENYMMCWHVTNKGSKALAPAYFKRGGTLARFQGLTMDEINDRISRAGVENGCSIFKDEISGRILYGPNQLCRH